MKAADCGRVVFVSSAAGVFGQLGLTGYAAAKTAMLGLMNVAAIVGAEFGIKANPIMPIRAASTLANAAQPRVARHGQRVRRVYRLDDALGDPEHADHASRQHLE